MILYVSIVERLHFLQAAPITSAIYFSQAISARRAISARSSELRDRWAMHPAFADRKRSSEIRSSRILESLPLHQVHFLPPSLARSSSLFPFSFRVRPRSQSRISCHLSFSKSLGIDRDRDRVGTLRWNCAIRLTPLRDRYVASRSVLFLGWRGSTRS